VRTIPSPYWDSNPPIIQPVAQQGKIPCPSNAAWRLIRGRSTNHRYMEVGSHTKFWSENLDVDGKMLEWFLGK